MDKIKTVHDYYESLYNKYPTIPKKDIQRIVNYGWKSLYLFNSYGGDVMIECPKFSIFIGSLTKNTLNFCKYYIKKLGIKFRVLYKRRKIKWDGYYYFALSDSLYENLIKQQNKRGRPKKKLKYGNIIFYKILDECKINSIGCKYIYRIPYITDVGYTFYKENFISDNAELIEVRDSANFKDLLVSNCKYNLL